MPRSIHADSGDGKWISAATTSNTGAPHGQRQRNATSRLGAMAWQCCMGQDRRSTVCTIQGSDELAS